MSASSRRPGYREPGPVLLVGRAPSHYPLVGGRQILRAVLRVDLPTSSSMVAPPWWWSVTSHRSSCSP